MSKQYRFWLGWVMVCLLGSGSGAAFADVVSVGNASGIPGASVNIPVSFTGSNAAALSFSIAYDPTKLTYASGTETVDPAFAAFNVTPALPQAGTIRVAMFSIKLPPLPLLPTGNIITFPFTINAAASAGQMPLAVTVLQALDKNNVDITATVTSTPGQITITSTAPVVTLSPLALGFGNQNLNTSATKTVTLTNSGNAALNITTVGVSGAGYSMANTTTCVSGGVVATGASCTVAVTFNPTAVGTNNGTLTITDNAAGSPQTVALTGSGVSSLPVVDLGGISTVNFGNQTVMGSSTTQTVTLTNNGTAVLSITSIVVTGNGFTKSGATTCGATLAAGANCMIAMTFTPTAVGTSTGSLVITDNAAGSPRTLPLTGIAVAAGAAAAAIPTLSEIAMLILALSLAAMVGRFGFARSEF